MAHQHTLRELRVAIAGYLGQLQSLDPSSDLLELDTRLEFDVNALASRLGWRSPFQRSRDGLWLAITGVNGSSCKVKIISPALGEIGTRPSRKRNPSSTGWDLLQRSKILGLSAQLNSWLIKIDRELAHDGDGTRERPPKAKRRGRKQVCDPAKDARLHQNFVDSGLKSVKEFARLRGENLAQVQAAFSRYRARKSRNK